MSNEITYEFGVMSSKWKLKSDDKNVAYLCMALHIATTAPIVIYSPESDGFKPIDILDKNTTNMDDEQFKKSVQDCMKTIKEVKKK